MNRKILLAILVALAAAPLADASILSKAFSNSVKTVDKAAKDTAAEVNRAKEKIAKSTLPGSLPGGVVPTSVVEEQISQIASTNERLRIENGNVTRENDFAVSGLFTVIGALITALFALATIGFFGRDDRRAKFLGAVIQEVELEERDFDFENLLPSYRRLCRQSATVASLRKSKAAIDVPTT